MGFKRWSVALLIAFCLLAPSAALAAGSRNLVENQGSTALTKGYRPYIEWYSSKIYYAGNGVQVPRRQTIEVYAIAGETLRFGSSVSDAGYASYAGISGIKDIRITEPSGATHDYDVIANGEGYISFAQERLGPSDLNLGGYQAFQFDVSETGVYKFNFFSPGTSANEVPQRKKADDSTAWTAQNQGSGVAAWDVTVLDASGAEQTGRVFTHYLTMTVGTNPNSDDGKSDHLKAVVYVLTSDGYIYSTDFNGMNPDGFLFFANNRGLIDDVTGNSLYHSSIYTDNSQQHLLGDTGFHSPALPDTSMDVTYRIFFERPNADFLRALGLDVAQPPANVSDFAFNEGGSALPGTGGDFTFKASTRSAFQIKLDFGADNVVYLASVCDVGTNVCHWDGLDYHGNVAQVGSYTATLTTKAGEYHFPFADAELNPNGLQIKLENVPSGADASFDAYKVYYDNSSKTINGDFLDFTTNSAALHGPLTQLGGVSSAKGSDGKTAAMRYEKLPNIPVALSYGNWKLFDVWTYFTAQAFVRTAPVEIVTRQTSLTVQKAWDDGGSSLRPASVSVTLYRDGAAHGTATLSAANGWAKTWTKLDASHAWTVDEPSVPAGYTKKLQVSGADWTITNTLIAAPTATPLPVVTPAPIAPVAPHTGDDSHAGLWLLLLLASGCGLVALTRLAAKRRRA